MQLPTFADTIFSWQLGATKPDREAFTALCRRLSSDHASLVFIDDSLRNVASADALGIDAIAFTTPADLRGELRSRSLID